VRELKRGLGHAGISASYRDSGRLSIWARPA
jgi:hypothetical protein